MCVFIDVSNIDKDVFKKIYESTKKHNLNFTKEKGGIVFTGMNPCLYK